MQKLGTVGSSSFTQGWGCDKPADAWRAADLVSGQLQCSPVSLEAMPILTRAPNWSWRSKNHITKARHSAVRLAQHFGKYQEFTG
jgi:hypothetical protein